MKLNNIYDKENYIVPRKAILLVKCIAKDI